MENELNELLKKIDFLSKQVEEHSTSYETHYSILNDWLFQLQIIKADIKDIKNEI